MRTFPPPLSVTLSPPSITMSGPVSLKIFAVASIVMITGSFPQSNVMMPPPATAATTAALVQLAAVPSPTTVVGDDTSASSASGGTAQLPSGLPAGGPSSGFVCGSGLRPPHPLAAAAAAAATSSAAAAA